MNNNNQLPKWREVDGGMITNTDGDLASYRVWQLFIDHQAHQIWVRHTEHDRYHMSVDPDNPDWFMIYAGTMHGVAFSIASLIAEQWLRAGDSRPAPTDRIVYDHCRDIRPVIHIFSPSFSNTVDTIQTVLSVCGWPLDTRVRLNFTDEYSGRWECEGANTYASGLYILRGQMVG